MYKSVKNFFKVATVLAGALNGKYPTKYPETKGHSKIGQKVTKSVTKINQSWDKKGPEFVIIPLLQKVKSVLFFANRAKNWLLSSKV